MPIISSSFKAAWWLNNRHLQTLFPALLRRQSALKTQRERLELDDGDFIDIDWYHHQAKANTPIVILMHGLAGSSTSSYIVGMQKALSQLGLASAAMNFRGCSGEPNRLARAYHSGETEDINTLFKHIKKCFKGRDIYVIGFSLGGNVLLKWLGEQQQNSLVKAAIAISPPMLLSACATQLDKGFSRVYRRYLLTPLKRFVINKKQHLKAINQTAEAQKIAHLGDLKDVKSFWQYDNQVVAPLHQFADVHSYYQRSSSKPFIAHIQVPTLIIHAADDPFMNAEVIPNQQELSALVQLEICAAGGHVGFVSGNNPLRPRYWLEQRVLEFLIQQGINDTKTSASSND